MRQNKETRLELFASRDIAYKSFIASLKGLKDAIRLIDDRITREGPSANYSANSDLVQWAMDVWKSSNAMYNIDMSIATIDAVNARLNPCVNEDASDVNCDREVPNGMEGNGEV
jgi:hypothetical protein